MGVFHLFKGGRASFPSYDIGEQEKLEKREKITPIIELEKMLYVCLLVRTLTHAYTRIYARTHAYTRIYAKSFKFEFLRMQTIN